MFDSVEVAVISQLLADPGAPAIARLRAAIRLGRIAEATEAQIIATMAIADGWDGEEEAFTYEADVTSRRLVRVGADGVLLDEALPLEIACAKHTSVGAATNLIRDIVDLKTRHPHTWQAVSELKAPVWQARHMAQACGRFEFTRQQAEAIDARVAPAWDKIGPARFGRVLIWGVCLSSWHGEDPVWMAGSSRVRLAGGGRRACQWFDALSL